MTIISQNGGLNSEKQNRELNYIMKKLSLSLLTVMLLQAGENQEEAEAENGQSSSFNINSILVSEAELGDFPLF